MLAIDTVLQNRYLILRPLKQGGMGAVYLAKDQRLGNTVALKETFFADEGLLKAFEREARLLAGLRHPALPRVSDHFAEGNGQFLIMEFIPGDDLEEMLQQRGYAFSPEEVFRWADQLLDALDYLHTQSTPIIHRDIKPQNLKLTDRGQIILLDFGLAKGSTGDGSRVTSNKSVFGYTPSYAPLEQIQGAGTGARSDLYSLAATLYHLVTNVAPTDALSRASAVLNGQPDPLLPADEVNPHVSAAAAAILTSAMALNREQRPVSAAAMRKALAGVRWTSAPVSKDQLPTIIQPQTIISAQATSTDQARDYTAASPARETEVLASPARSAPPQSASTQQLKRRDPLLVLSIGSIAALIVVGIIMTSLMKTDTATPYLNVDTPASNSNAPAANSGSNSNAPPAEVRRGGEINVNQLNPKTLTAEREKSSGGGKKNSAPDATVSREAMAAKARPIENNNAIPASKNADEPPRRIFAKPPLPESLREKVMKGRKTKPKRNNGNYPE